MTNRKNSLIIRSAVFSNFRDELTVVGQVCVIESFPTNFRDLWEIACTPWSQPCISRVVSRAEFDWDILETNILIGERFYTAQNELLTPNKCQHYVKVL